MHMQQQFPTQFSRNPWSTSAAALRGPGAVAYPLEPPGQLECSCNDGQTLLLMGAIWVAAVHYLGKIEDGY